LAELALAASRPADVDKLAQQLMQIDPASPFTERTFAMRSESGAPALTAPKAH
jgi:hypothetical protein